MCYNIILKSFNLLGVSFALRNLQEDPSVVTNQEKEKYWIFLSLYYVTEGSDDPDNPNGIILFFRGGQKVMFFI